MKSSGVGAEKEEEADIIDDEVRVASPLASVSPIPASCSTAARRDASKTSVTGRNRSKSRRKLGKDDTCTKQESDPAPQGTIVAANAGKRLNQIDNERQMLQIKGIGKILLKQNWNECNIVAPNQWPKDIQVGPWTIQSQNLSGGTEAQHQVAQMERGVYVHSDSY